MTEHRVIQFAYIATIFLQFFHCLETVKETAAFVSNESRKPEALRRSKHEGMHILSKTLGNTSSKTRHSSRIRIPNSRFGYLLPGFLEQSGNGKNDNTESSDGSKEYSIFQDLYVNASALHL